MFIEFHAFFKPRIEYWGVWHYNGVLVIYDLYYINYLNSFCKAKEVRHSECGEVPFFRCAPHPPCPEKLDTSLIEGLHFSIS